MENLTQQLLKMTEKGGFEWSGLFEKTSAERKESFNKLIGNREEFTSCRHFSYELPSEIHQGWHVDTVYIHLFNNGTCLLYWDQGNIDHNSNDHRVGVYEETNEKIVTKTISLWRSEGNEETYVFTKQSNGSLLYKDDSENSKCKEKVLVLKH